jgi:ribonucleotide reductase alpha subunit
VRGSNGKSSGIIPMLRVFNNIARHIDQCFIPETIIYTEDGPKQICDVTTEDKVITIDGKFKKVNEIFINEVDKDILNIRTSRSFESISVTKEHQLYVLRNQRKMTNFNDIKKRLEAKTIKGEFISAKDLKDDDMVAYPVVDLIDTDQTINEDLSNYYRMVGIMLGDGHITENRNESGITVNKVSKIKTYNFVKEFLNFNNIHFWETDQIGSVQLRWSNTDKFNLNRDDIYDSNKEKCIPTKFYKLNKHYTKQLIKGLLETDGSIIGEISFSTTSYNLTHGIRYLLLKIGVVSSGCIKDNRGKTHEIRPGEFITNKKITYYVRIPKVKEVTDILEIEEGKFFKSFTYGDKIWSRVLSVTERKYEGNVYDLNIEDNHNYVVGSFGLVHNSGKRFGSIAVYLEPWHQDVMEFLDLRKNHGNEEERCRDLFLALWVPDLFMKRVQENGVWSLMCPDQCRGLTTVYGEDFEKLYIQYENEGKFRKQVKAQDVFYKIVEAQLEGGTPYILFKDAINKKSNQKNLGTIKSSNLCCEINIYTNHEDEIGVCNLASICLPKYINYDDMTYNHTELHKIAKILVKNLNKVIDRNYYPLKKAENSNFRNRPVGLGISGLADVYAILKIPFENEKARKLNKEIFETIYHGALEASMEIAKKRNEWYNISSYNKDYVEKWNNDNSIGEDPNLITQRLRFIPEELNKLPKEYIGSYSSFVGSPIYQGLLQFDLWNKVPDSGRYDWNLLKSLIKENGIRNSLLLAPMP